MEKPRFSLRAGLVELAVNPGVVRIATSIGQRVDDS